MAPQQTIMILGAGIYQVPLIRTARRLGLRTVVVSYPGPYPGFAEADEIVHLDTTDATGICQAACDYQVGGIVTTGTDVAVRSIGHTCDALGLHGISEHAAQLVTDKSLMKRALIEGGVNTSPYHVVRTLSEALDAAESIGYPVMAKACDVSGSRGISKVDNADEMPSAFDEAMAATRQDYIIVEGFTAGYEIGVDGYVTGGHLALFAPHRKFVAHFGAVTVPSGHGFPLDADAGLMERIREQLDLCVAATGMDECAVNGDFIVAPDGSVHVIEVGGRCGATCIPELVHIHTGIDLYEQMIRGALGQPVELEVTQTTPCMAKLLFSDSTAVVGSVDREALDLLADKTSAQISLDVAPGDSIHAARNGTDRWGQVIMATSDEDELDAVMDQVRNCIVLA